ncbi:MAG: TetR/AcrR family transcriptional regulator [Nocardioides sp.]|nr:TetR/AcrR family transcriptional regulator [Nocardioides sp.]
MSTAPPGGRGRRPSRAEVRAELLSSAARVFAQRGIDGASLDDIAADAGYTKGAVYSNFTNKEGLVAALVEDRSAAYLSLGVSAAGADDGPLESRARSLGDALEKATQEHRDWHLLLVEMWQRTVRDDPATQDFRAHRTAMRDSIATAVSAHARATGSELTVPAEHIAVTIMALANGMAMERLIDPRDAPDGLTGKVLAGLAGSFTRRAGGTESGAGQRPV